MAQVEEVVSTDDEMPGLEDATPVPQTAPSGPQVGEKTTDMFGNETIVRQPGKQSKSEKKARKAMKTLGMKPVPGIVRVTVKKAKNVLFVISDPDVMKSPASDTYVIFGQAKIEDMASQNAAAAAEQFKAPDDATADDVPDLVGADEDDDDEEVDATGIDEVNITAVMTTINCSRNKAIKALKKNNGVAIDAIMDLTG
jgi:nascent polypeptide-associated complex subunit alpha